MQHNYTDEEIRTAWKDSLSLHAFLAALPERPQAAEIAALKAALAESEKQFQDKIYEIGRLLDVCDKAQGILKDCLAVMPFGNIKTHTVENLPHRIADLASEIASLSLENERLEAELAALRQPLLADAGRSLGQVLYEAGAAVANNTPGQPPCDPWSESEDCHEAAELAAKAVASVVLAQAVRRMEAVPVDELWYDYEAANTGYGGMGAVRARLIAAAKGEGQTVVVNKPPKSEKQPDLCGESEKQDPFEELKAAHAAGKIIQMKLKDDPDDTWDDIPDPGWGGDPDEYRIKPEPAQPTTSPSWTPAVGDTVRLKSGGPVMTVTDVDPLSLMCAWMNASNELQVEPITTLCLEPAQP